MQQHCFVHSCTDFSPELHGHNGFVYTSKQRQGLFLTLKSSSKGCLIFTLLQKTSRRPAMSLLPTRTHEILLWPKALSLRVSVPQAACCKGCPAARAVVLQPGL